MKLIISKNKEGNGYYSKIINKYNDKTNEYFLSIQLSKDIKELEYGFYEVDGFMSCYKGKDGTIKPKFIVTSAKPTTKYEKNNKITQDDLRQDDPFQEYGEQIEITDDMLD
jgi:hypothetical protein